MLTGAVMMYILGGATGVAALIMGISFCVEVTTDKCAQARISAFNFFIYTFVSASSFILASLVMKGI